MHSSHDQQKYLKNFQPFIFTTAFLLQTINKLKYPQVMNVKNVKLNYKDSLPTNGSSKGIVLFIKLTVPLWLDHEYMYNYYCRCSITDKRSSGGDCCLSACNGKYGVVVCLLQLL